MEMVTDLAIGQELRVSPRLIQANHVLGLSSLELQQFIHQEVSENPALEASEQLLCPSCGTVLVDVTCRACLIPRDISEARPSDSSEAYDQTPLWDRGALDSREDDYDPLLHVAQGMTLRERLLVDLEVQLNDPCDVPVAEYLVGSLDENGRLRCTPAEVTAALRVDEARFERVLGLLHGLEPAGIGARDLQECLLLQIAHLEQRGVVQPHVREIVVNHFQTLAGRKYRLLARALHISLAAAMEACHFIRDNLSPFPAHLAALAPHSATLPYLLPDVIISLDDEDALTVTTIESKRYTVRVSPQYQQIYQEAEACGAVLSEADREHVRRYVNRAKRFLSNLEQRRQTMQKIGECVAVYQEDYLRHGVRYLKPLTRAMVAAATGMHESTISRATAGKYVMVPSGHVIPWSNFFTAALNAKDVIKTMVSQETEPLDDQKIVTLLQEHGHFLARRTVAKYRDELGILPAALRR